MTMKIDLRILVVVTLFLAMGASLVVITQYIRKPVLQSIREVIPLTTIHFHCHLKSKT